MILKYDIVANPTWFTQSIKEVINSRHRVLYWDDYIHIELFDISKHVETPEEGEPVITYTRHFERDDVGEDGNPIKVLDSEDYTAQMLNIIAEIDRKVLEHDPNPIEPPLSAEEQRIQDLENIVADLMLGGM